MKKFITLFLFVTFILIIILSNINVTTRQGINYKWQTIKIPLYLKILDFFDRHYNYKYLVKKIIEEEKTDEGRVMKIFKWTYNNIRKAPEGFPIVDDHVWYIIVRGYGVEDQSSDVFSTLCNYAGLDAFYSCVHSKDDVQCVPLSFVRIKGRWFVFDPYHGIYFKDREGRLADVGIFKSGGNWTMETLGERSNIDYTSYLSFFPTIEKVGLNRSNVQSPLRRFIFEIKKWLK